MGSIIAKDGAKKVETNSTLIPLVELKWEDVEDPLVGKVSQIYIIHFWVKNDILIKNCDIEKLLNLVKLAGIKFLFDYFGQK